MSTFSVFRRNQKTWLAVLGVLTMLSFVFIPTLEQCNRRFAPGSQPVLTSKMFGNLSGSQFETIRQRQNSIYMIVTQGNFRGLDTVSVASTWLKAKFAEKNGFVVADSEISSFIRDRFDSKEAYENALKNVGMSTSAFEEGLREILLADKYQSYCLAGIGFQMNMYGMPLGQPAFPQTNQEKWDYFCTLYRAANLDVMPIRAEDFIAKVDAPSKNDVNLFFEANKENLPDVDAGVVGFKTPRKMRIQYLAYTKPIQTVDEDIPLELSTPDSIDLEEVAPVEAPDEVPTEEVAPAEVPAEEVAPVETPAEVPAEEVAPVEAPAEVPAEEVAPVEAQPQASVASNPFRFVAEETVTTEPAPEEAYDGKAFSKMVQSDLSAYKTKFSAYEINQTEGAEKPVLEFSAETKAYMDKYGIKFGEMELMDIFALAKTPIAQSVGFNRLGAKTFACIETSDIANEYIVWNAETVQESVPEFNAEIEKAVVETMKFEKAKELARKAAQDTLKACQEAKALVGTVMPASVEHFSRRTMTVEGYPAPTPLENYPQLENVDERFRAGVFEMIPGEMKVLANRNDSIFYVTLLKAYEPSDEDLRAMYESMKDNPQYVQMSMFSTSQKVNEDIQNWHNSLFEEAGVEFAQSRDMYEE